jgi:hypothetical protein
MKAARLWRACAIVFGTLALLIFAMEFLPGWTGGFGPRLALAVMAIFIGLLALMLNVHANIRTPLYKGLTREHTPLTSRDLLHSRPQETAD